MTFKVDIEGLKRLEHEIELRLREIEGNVLRGLVKSGQLIQRRSDQRVPIDTGALRASSYTRPVGTNRVDVGYKEHYAVVQHEDLTFKHPNGGEAKYLEKAVKETIPDIPRICRDEARV